MRPIWPYLLGLSLGMTWGFVIGCLVMRRHLRRSKSTVWPR